MGSNGEPHEQISLEAGSGPWVDGEASGGVATVVESAALDLEAGPPPLEPWDDEPVTVVRHVGLDVVLVKSDIVQEDEEGAAA